MLPASTFVLLYSVSLLGTRFRQQIYNFINNKNGIITKKEREMRSKTKKDEQNTSKNRKKYKRLMKEMKTEGRKSRFMFYSSADI